MAKRPKNVRAGRTNVNPAAASMKTTPSNPALHSVMSAPFNPATQSMKNAGYKQGTRINNTGSPVDPHAHLKNSKIPRPR